MRLASGLPFAPLVGPGNVAVYLDVLIAAEGVAEGVAETMRQQQLQQQQQR